MKKGGVKKHYDYTEHDIAKIAGVSIRSLRVAKVRKTINPSDLRSVVQYVVEHWLRQTRRGL